MKIVRVERTLLWVIGSLRRHVFFGKDLARVLWVLQREGNGRMRPEDNLQAVGQRRAQLEHGKDIGSSTAHARNGLTPI